MNNERPIAFPTDLEEDWRLAQITEAPIEYVPELLDEWRTLAEPHPELYVPKDLAIQELVGDLHEPAPDAMQRLLFAVAQLRPANIEPGVRLAEAGASETHHQLTALNHEARLGLNEHAAQWARATTYMLEGVTFARGEKMHQCFLEAVPDESKWTSLALQAYGAYASAGHHEALERIVALMANEERFQVLIRKIIGLNLAQIQYWRDLHSTRRVKYIDRRLKQDEDRGIVEPLLQLEYVASTLPLDEIIDDATGELIASPLPEPEPTPNGVVMLQAIAGWRALEKQSPTTQEYSDTRSILTRSGLPGNQFAKLAYWARRVSFDAAGIEWEYAAAAHEQYGLAHQMNGNAWSEHTKELRSQYLGKDSELDQLLETCMELVGVPQTGRDLCRRVVALTTDEAMYWKQLAGFAHEVDEALDDESSIETLRQQLGSWAVREPSMVRRSDLRFTEAELTHLPIDTLVQEESESPRQNDS